MSGAKTKARWFRIYSSDRKIRKAVGANTLEELITEAKKKLGVESAEAVTIVLEEDGTCVDEEEYFQHGLEANCVLMLLRSNEAWTECGELESHLDESDGDEPDSAISSHDENAQLKHLCSRLRQDLKQVLLFTSTEYQMLIDADKNLLSRLLHRNPRDIELIQSACQQYVDERDDYREAVNLLQLLHKDSHHVTAAGDAVAMNNDAEDGVSKRKRRK